MARRTAGNMHGQQFLANTRSREVHDLDNEKPQCQIDAIIAAGHDAPYLLLSSAHADGYDNCAHCMRGSVR